MGGVEPQDPAARIEAEAAAIRNAPTSPPLVPSPFADELRAMREQVHALTTRLEDVAARPEKPLGMVGFQSPNHEFARTEAGITLGDRIGMTDEPVYAAVQYGVVKANWVYASGPGT
ncbi:MAG TPA: hypothetical protein VM487_20490, partial [Phycisphaerae bacterium]|nr:hypothetical protein [Phycisphaerae bacterium]